MTCRALILLAFVCSPIYLLANDQSKRDDLKREYDKAKKKVHQTKIAALQCERRGLNDKLVKKAILAEGNLLLREMADMLNGTGVRVEKTPLSKEMSEVRKDVSRSFSGTVIHAWGDCYPNLKKDLSKIKKTYAVKVSGIKYKTYNVAAGKTTGTSGTGNKAKYGH